jgi:glycerophosphoryl diester phosphodiesterase
MVASLSSDPAGRYGQSMAIDAEVGGWRRAGPKRPLVIAHRGASRWELENTEAAFALAAAQGADGVELDVLLCRSGEVVVFHDDDLLRLGGRADRVETLSLRALRRVRLDQRGSRLQPVATTPVIPTLAEAMAACGPRLLVNVELKSGGAFDVTLPDLVERVSRVLDQTGAAPRVLVSSFDPRAVGLWRRRRPDVPCALLLESGGGAFCKAMTLPLLAPIAVHPESVFCRPDLVRAWHAGGYLVNTWTVDEPAQLRALAAAGVDGVITNDPAGALAALAAP